jgi:hypothetical protein
MALGSTRPLRDMSVRNLPGGKVGPAHKADNLTAIRLEHVGPSTCQNHMCRASTTCNRDSFTFYLFLYV